MIKVAFGSVPKDGGTFTFYRNMRPALLHHGIDMRCVSIGKAQAMLWEDAYVDEGCVLLSPSTRNIKKQAMAFAEWCESEKTDVVMGINSEAILSALPHLPEHIRCVARCANSFDHGYRITLSGYERLAAIIAQTPRQLKDLTETYRAAKKKITVIPNGINETLLKTSATRKSNNDGPLRLGFLGRLEHKQKGVLFIPEIVRELNRQNVSFTLRIAGKGKHGEKLKTALAPEIENRQIEFLGAIPPDAVPHFLSNTDVFIFPSQFEGCPNALLEAMMAGCVPVSWMLPGITDFIINDGQTGFLNKLGDCTAFANKILFLSNDRSALSKMGELAASETQSRFSTTVASENYAKLFKSVMATAAPHWEPKKWGSFERDPNFPHYWKEYIPLWIKSPFKKFIRT